MLRQLTDPRRFPALTTFIDSGVFEAADDPDDEFVFGLDRILDGIEPLVRWLALVFMDVLTPAGRPLLS